jgi:hypothetical protein
VGRVRKSAKKRNQTSSDQTERGGMMREEGEDGLWSSSSEHRRRGSHSSSTHLSDPQDETKVVVQEAARNSVSPFGTLERGWRCARQATRSPCTTRRSPSFILVHPTSPSSPRVSDVRVLKRHVSEGETDLGAEFTSSLYRQE